MRLENREISKTFVVIGPCNSIHLQKRLNNLNFNFILYTFQQNLFLKYKKNTKIILIKSAFKSPIISNLDKFIKLVKSIKLSKELPILIFYSDWKLIFMSLILNRKFVLSFWGSDINDITNLFYIPLFKKVYLKALHKSTTIFAVSPEIKKKLNTLGYSKKIIMQRYSIDLSLMKFEPNLEPFETKKFKLFSVRWIQPNYNTKQILKIFEQLEINFRNIKLTLIGPAKEIFSDDSYFQKDIKPFLKKSINLQTNLNHNLFLKLMKNHDIIISMAIRDGSPVSILEAMALGRLVIAGKNESINSIIKHGINGFIVDSNNISQTVANIVEILNSTPQDILKILKNARKFVENNADFKKEINRLNKVLLNL